MEDRPKARTEGVIAEWVDDELVVYDQRTHTAHCLSPRLASVRELCDGRCSCAEMAQRLALEPAAVRQAVDELHACGMLDVDPIHGGTYSRREASVRLAKVGGATLAAPLIYSAVIAPAMAAASSCLATNSPEPNCTASNNQTKSDARCCSGICYNAGGTKTCAFALCVPFDGPCTPGLNQCCAGPNHCSGGTPSVCVA